ncbi:MAG: hypothetical protein IGS39_00110 [Calothrix sp. C42_A2020_038]|nr:hypothetical protein [Calothrix sp. C42_A2020_038]
MAKNLPHYDHINLWRERIIAIIAFINLLLVFFDVTYLYARDFYLEVVPNLTQLYDPVKGVQAHPEIETYIRQVDNLSTQVLENRLEPAVVETELEQLRQRSLQIIEGNYFTTANKTKYLAKIKQKVRRRTGETYTYDAFNTFWSQNYLNEAGWQQEINFWNTQIRPLIQKNYYRDVNRFGIFVDYFWLIDLPFVIIFTCDILARIVFTKRRHPKITWLKSCLRRWYDIFLLLPFWRLLRVIPVTIRLHHTGLLNLEPVRVEAQRDFLIGFAAEITEMVGIQIIDQLQKSIEKGDFTRWLLHPESRQPYVQVGGRNELEVLANRLLDVSVYDVIPKIKPDIETLLHYSIHSSLNQMPIWQKLQNIPGLNNLPSQLAENLAKSLSSITYSSLINSLEDPIAAENTNRLIKNFRDSLEEELRKQHNVEEIETLLIDFLEEIKINYVKGIQEVGIEQLLEETDNLHYKIESYARSRNFTN